MTFKHQQVTLHVEGNKLEGHLLRVEDTTSPRILILGGGANIPYNEGYYATWQKKMAEQGMSSLSFDFRGVGSSDGKLGETTLNTRLDDAREASKLLGLENIYIAGISMGAPLAIRLANEIKAKGVILISPAAYSEEARVKYFGDEFSMAIRKPHSWENSPDFEELVKFKGSIILAYGKQDNVIPEPVLQKYSDIVIPKGLVLAFENVGHRLMRENDAASVQAREILYRTMADIVAK